MQPHILKFHLSLGIIKLQTFKLSIVLPKRQVFSKGCSESISTYRKVFGMCLPRKVVYLLPLVMWLSISPDKATLLQIADLFISLRKSKEFSAPMIKGYRTVLNLAFSVVSTFLSKNKVGRMLFHNFEKTWSP